MIAQQAFETSRVQGGAGSEVARGAGAIAAVQTQLPAGFPDAVATPILDGVARALQQLGAG